MNIYQNINIVVKRHLEWITWLEKHLDEYTLSDQICMKGLQFGLTEEKKEIDCTVDFLRVKANMNVPNWIVELPSIPKKIIVDYIAVSV